MSKEDVIESLKSRNFKVVEIAEIIGKTKQTIYNYAQYYDSGEVDKIPPVMLKLISMCMSKDISQEEIDAFWFACTARIKVILNDIEYFENALISDKAEYDSIVRGGLVAIDNITDPEEMKKVIQESIDSNTERLYTFKSQLAKEQEDLLSRSISSLTSGNPSKTGKSGPNWSGNDVGTLCVSDSGDYMIVVNPESNPGAIDTKLRLYSVIDESLVFLKTMDFEKGSNMIEFSLIPKLIYRYEVIQITNTEVKSSGVLDLKNYL